jgi:hypothetical protein
MELYLVFIGSFSTIKNKRLPSAEMVGLNSDRAVLMLAPKFSTLTIVVALIIFSFCETNFPTVSIDVCALDTKAKEERSRSKVSFFKGQDLAGKIIENQEKYQKKECIAYYLLINNSR